MISATELEHLQTRPAKTNAATKYIVAQIAAEFGVIRPRSIRYSMNWARPKLSLAKSRHQDPVSHRQASHPVTPARIETVTDAAQRSDSRLGRG